MFTLMTNLSRQHLDAHASVMSVLGENLYHLRMISRLKNDFDPGETGFQDQDLDQNVIL